MPGPKTEDRSSGSRTDRQRAVDKAVKVYRQGVSTPHSGEKRKCLQVLLRLVEPHGVMLSELDSSLPRRWDMELLEIRLGLADAPGPSHGSEQRSARPGSSRAQASPGRGQPAAGGQKHGTSASTVDFEVLLFQHLSGAERRRLLHGPRFSQGLFQAVRGTSAYSRLLAEAHALDVSNIGVRLGDQTLMQWLDRILSRQGSRVKCRAAAQTIYDDLVSYCRLEYVTYTREDRQATQRDQSQEEARRVGEARRQAAEARRDRERRAQSRRRKAEEARHARGGESASQQSAGTRTSSQEPFGTADQSRRPSATTQESVVFFREFHHLAEARLYLRVARLQVGLQGHVRSFSRNRVFVVELVVPSTLKEAVDLSYQRALSALQGAAERIRAEAAAARDEAIRQAEAAYAEQYEQAFEIAVERYTS
ncbi:hypothetical protein DEDE109153_15790 [Deinococcus deserti]